MKPRNNGRRTRKRGRKKEKRGRKGKKRNQKQRFTLMVKGKSARSKIWSPPSLRKLEQSRALAVCRRLVTKRMSKMKGVLSLRSMISLSLQLNLVACQTVLKPATRGKEASHRVIVIMVNNLRLKIISIYIHACFQF